MSRRKKAAVARKNKEKAGRASKGGPPRKVVGKPSLDAVPEWFLVAIVFAVALAVRLVYLGQLNDTPFFDHPVGDSRIYHERALDIAAGDLVGKEAYFHSSPFYPYFMALVYKVFGVNFTFLRIIQFLIGSANCVVIYLLTRKISPRRRGPALAAGLAAAWYGTLVFFDGDLLMITLVLFFTSVSVLLTASLIAPEGPPGTSSRPWGKPAAAVVAGLLLGFAGLGKPNVLLFAPFGVLWILTGFTRRWVWARRREVVLYTLGCVLAVSPITLRNYLVSKDFVLVSSNAGVNFFIGNNALADGIFMLPADSGLENTRLYLSSRDAAEAATGRTGLKPSQVSAYWTSRAFDYMKQRPRDAAALWARKFHLFWNHYEIPNHHNKYFITRAYAPVLNRFAVGYGFVAPLAITGLLLVFLSGPVAPVTRLYVGFILVYMGSLIPFFITARYRLPVVPFLVVFAATGLWALVDCFRRKRWVHAATAVGVGAAAAAFAWWPMVSYDFGFNHTVIGTVYSDKATEQPDRAVEHVKRAILEYKTALELRPLSVDAHYNLGITYQRIGYYSGAVRELETAVALKPNHAYAAKALGEVRAELERTGDKIVEAALPRTTFELASDHANSGRISEAAALYERVLEQDPHHVGAYSQLGTIRFDRGEYEAAIGWFKKGLRYQPDHFVLNNNIAGAYFKAGDLAAARRHWERCLELDPDNESVKRQLRLVGR